MSAFRLPIANLPEGPSRVLLEGDGAALELPLCEWATPLTLALQVDKAGEQLTLRGRLSGQARAECARCLETFPHSVDAEFAALAERSGRFAGDVESASGADYVLLHDGRTVDLTEAVREQVLLALPMVWTCRPDCAGLCPRCGENRNAGHVSCKTASGG